MLRSECELPLGLRPCPFISCRHNMTNVVEHPNGRVTIAGIDLAADATAAEIEAFTERVAELVATRRLPSCALDLANANENTLEDIGHAIELTRERIRQIESKGKRCLAELARRAGVRLR